MTVLQPGRNQSALIPSDEFRKMREDLILELKPAISIIKSIAVNTSKLTEREREAIGLALKKVERILFELENQL